MTCSDDDQSAIALLIMTREWRYVRKRVHLDLSFTVIFWTDKFNLELWPNHQFNFGDNTGILRRSACPLLIESTMLLFGGKTEPRQVTEVYPWGASITRRIFTLPFDFVEGSCAYHQGIVYLCFDWYDVRLCRSR